MTTTTPPEVPWNMLKKMNCYYGTVDEKRPIKPFWSGTAKIWVNDEAPYPYYNFYNTGTSALIVLKYNFVKKRWSQVDSIEFGKLPFYRIIWKMSFNMEKK